MKPNTRKGWLLAGALLGGLLGSTGAAAAQALPAHFRSIPPPPSIPLGPTKFDTNHQAFAIVRAVRGDSAQILGPDYEWKPMKVGKKLATGDVIRTDENSTLDLFLGDNGPIVRLAESTVLTIASLRKEVVGGEKIIETLLTLEHGRILGNVKKLAPASKYEILTPTGVAAIRGTEYEITADGWVTVHEGKVLVLLSRTEFSAPAPDTPQFFGTYVEARQTFGPPWVLPVEIEPPDFVSTGKPAVASIFLEPEGADAPPAKTGK